jgi:hypothetical protein
MCTQNACVREKETEKEDIYVKHKTLQTNYNKDSHMHTYIRCGVRLLSQP